MPDQRVTCDICGRAVPPHGHYVVKVEVYADPAMPAVDAEALEEVDLDAAMAELLEQMKGMSADELQDQVHRAFEYRICLPCQRGFVANPLGLPRGRGSAADRKN